jgi:hypothetical protein
MSAACHYGTDLTDEQWEVLQLLLPPPTWRPGGPGRPPCDLRLVINGIWDLNKTGCRDYERLTPNSVVMIQISMIRLLLNRLV